jgi:hypothetical protein
MMRAYKKAPLKLTATSKATIDQDKRDFTDLEAVQLGRYATCSAAKRSEPSRCHLVSRTSREIDEVAVDNRTDNFYFYASFPHLNHVKAG